MATRRRLNKFNCNNIWSKNNLQQQQQQKQQKCSLFSFFHISLPCQLRSTRSFAHTSLAFVCVVSLIVKHERNNFKNNNEKVYTSFFYCYCWSDEISLSSHRLFSIHICLLLLLLLRVILIWEWELSHHNHQCYYNWLQIKTIKYEANTIRTMKTILMFIVSCCCCCCQHAEDIHIFLEQIQKRRQNFKQKLLISKPWDENATNIERGTKRNHDSLSLICFDLQLQLRSHTKIKQIKLEYNSNLFILIKISR